MASKEYFEDKSKLYYENFINNKCTKKVRGIVLNDDGEILLLHSKKHNGYSIPGGTVEAGENIKETVVREVLEETGASIIPIKVVGKYYHTSKNFNYDGITFDSERVEYFYFCKFKGFLNDNLGLKGEFDDGDVKIVFLDYEEAITSRLLKRDKSMIERAMNEFLLYKADEFNEPINISHKKYHKFNKNKNNNK
ncbi:MAG: NUDIX hydrolase [Clostridia bacterium]|nr:NUDIX hydrolase [Clostridia bacterium]